MLRELGAHNRVLLGSLSDEGICAHFATFVTIQCQVELVDPGATSERRTANLCEGPSVTLFGPLPCSACHVQPPQAAPLRSSAWLLMPGVYKTIRDVPDSI